MSDIKPKEKGLFDKLMDGLEAMAGGAESVLLPPEGEWKAEEIGDANGIDPPEWEVRNTNGKKVYCRTDGELAKRIERLLNAD